jgi:acyl-coenzyme A synthetase/AMP-(fatty) acid ligase
MMRSEVHHGGAMLADHEVPEDIHLDPVPLPRNANGKLLKRNLRDRLVATA